MRKEKDSYKLTIKLNKKFEHMFYASRLHDVVDAEKMATVRNVKM